MNEPVKLITDEKIELRKELRELKVQIDFLSSMLLSLKFAYSEKKKRYEEIDAKRAMVDGRLKVVQLPTRGGTRKSGTAKQLDSLSKGQLLSLIAALETIREEEEE